MLSTAPPLSGASAATTTTTRWTGAAPLRVRRLAARRRRLVLRARDWLGITAITCFSLTLCAVTLFSMLGR